MKIDMQILESRILAAIMEEMKPITVKQISTKLGRNGGYRPTMPTLQKGMVNLHIRGMIEKLPQRTKMKEVLWKTATE